MTRVRHVIRAVLAAAIAVLAALLPARVQAACDILRQGPDAISCVADAAVYDFWFGLASLLWTAIVKPLLGATYWVDHLRVWIVTNLFDGMYSVLQTTLGGLIGPFAVLALTIAALCMIAMPITGSTGPVNLRTILIWLTLGPQLLVYGGTLFAQIDTLRSDVATALVAAVETRDLDSTLGIARATGSDVPMTTPVNLYRSAPCGLRDKRNGQVAIDDQVAAMVLAKAEDIHCPGATTSAALPAAMFGRPTIVAERDRFAVEGGVSEEDSAGRATWIGRIKAGINRLALAIVPAALGLVAALINLALTLALMLIWFGLPIGFLFSVFRRDSGWFVDLIRRAAEVIGTSWLIAVFMGLVLALLTRAAASGSADRYAMFLFVLGILIVKFAFMAVGQLTNGMQAMVGATGIPDKGPSFGGMVSGAAGLAIGAATGGATLAAAGMATAATGAVAMRETGNGRYALATMAGRSERLTKLGTLAAGAGVLDDESERGLYAGYRSRRSALSGLTSIRKDAQATNIGAQVDRTTGETMYAGTTLRNRAVERQIDTQIRRTTDGTLVQRGARQVGRAVDAIGQGPQQAVAAAAGALVDGSVRVARGAAQVTVQTVRDPIGAVDATGRRITAAIVPPPDRRGQALTWQAARRRVAYAPAPESLPDDAETGVVAPAVLVAYLRQGGTAIRNADGTVTRWGVAAKPAKTGKSDHGERPAQTTAAASTDAAQPAAHTGSTTDRDTPSASAKTGTTINLGTTPGAPPPPAAATQQRDPVRVTRAPAEPPAIVVVPDAAPAPEVVVRPAPSAPAIVVVPDAAPASEVQVVAAPAAPTPEVVVVPDAAPASEVVVRPAPSAPAIVVVPDAALASEVQVVAASGASTTPAAPRPASTRLRRTRTAASSPTDSSTPPPAADTKERTS